VAETKTVAELVADNWDDQIDQQNAADAQSRAHQETTRAEIEDARAALLRRLTDRTAQKQQVVLPVPVQEIITVLLQQPRFVEPMRQHLTELVRRVNAAVDSAIGTMNACAADTTPSK